MAAYQLPTDLSHRITDSVEYLWNYTRGLDPQSVLSPLPPVLRLRVIASTQQEILDNVGVFKDTPHTFRAALAARLTVAIYVPGDTVVEQGDFMPAVYFVRVRGGRGASAVGWRGPGWGGVMWVGWVGWVGWLGGVGGWWMVDGGFSMFVGGAGESGVEVVYMGTLWRNAADGF